MHTQHIVTELFDYQNIPLIDGEFDRFELNDDLEANLREAGTATFYHDAFDLEE